MLYNLLTSSSIIFQSEIKCKGRFIYKIQPFRDKTKILIATFFVVNYHFSVKDEYSEVPIFFFFGVF